MSNDRGRYSSKDYYRHRALGRDPEVVGVEMKENDLVCVEIRCTVSAQVHDSSNFKPRARKGGREQKWKGRAGEWNHKWQAS
jgi:hypothetical protein